MGRPASTDELDEAIHDLLELAVLQPSQPGAQALSRDRADLRNLDPGVAWQSSTGHSPGQRIARALRLTREREDDRSARAVVEQVVAQHQHWPCTALLVAPYRLKIGPVDIASQYMGQGTSPTRRSSARSCSSAAFSLASSCSRDGRFARACRTCSSADCTARLRLGNSPAATHRSTSARSRESSVTATFV